MAMGATCGHTVHTHTFRHIHTHTPVPEYCPSWPTMKWPGHHLGELEDWRTPLQLESLHGECSWFWGGGAQRPCLKQV